MFSDPAHTCILIHSYSKYPSGQERKKTCALHEKYQSDVFNHSVELLIVVYQLAFTESHLREAVKFMPHLAFHKVQNNTGG